MIKEIGQATIMALGIAGICMVAYDIFYEQNKRDIARARAEASPVFRDFTGDGRRDLAFKDEEGYPVCMINNGESTFVGVNTYFPKGSNAFYCYIPGKGYLNPATGLLLDTQNHKE